MIAVEAIFIPAGGHPADPLDDKNHVGAKFGVIVHFGEGDDLQQKIREAIAGLEDKVAEALEAKVKESLA